MAIHKTEGGYVISSQHVWRAAQGCGPLRLRCHVERLVLDRLEQFIVYPCPADNEAD